MMLARVGDLTRSDWRPPGRTDPGASRALVLSDLGVDACGRAGALREAFVRSGHGARAPFEALPPSAEADGVRLFTADKLSAARLFTIGGGGGPFRQRP